MRVNIGDVVLARFHNFDDELVTAMFVVSYHECDDVKGSTNFEGLKISTHSRGFQIPLLQSSLPFLDHDSFLNCNRAFPLREDGVLEIVGRLNTYYLNKMLQQMYNCLDRSRSQICKLIGEENMFDINKPQVFK